MAENNPQELCSCHGCAEEIPTDRARVSCHSCPNYHLCANCFVIKKFSKHHSESHSTIVFKLSGFVVPTPPGFPRRNPPLPPRSNSATTARQTNRVSELPTANWGALWNAIKGPLEKREKKKGSTDGTTSETPPSSTPEKEEENCGFKIAPTTRHSMNQFSPSPPKSARQRMERVDSTAPSSQTSQLGAIIQR